MMKKTKHIYSNYCPMEKLDTVEHYEKNGIKLTMQVMGIPRSTIYRWVKLHKSGKKNWEKGVSKRPKHLARKKTTNELIEQIITLKRNHPQMPYKQIVGRLSTKLSASTICRVLKKYKNG